MNAAGGGAPATVKRGWVRMSWRPVGVVEDGAQYRRAMQAKVTPSLRR